MAKAEFEATFATLRKLLKPHAKSYPPIRDVYDSGTQKNFERRGRSARRRTPGRSPSSK
jgi:hypothetical protein